MLKRKTSSNISTSQGKSQNLVRLKKRQHFFVVHFSIIKKETPLSISGQIKHAFFSTSLFCAPFIRVWNVLMLVWPFKRLWIRRVCIEEPRIIRWWCPHAVAPRTLSNLWSSLNGMSNVTKWLKRPRRRSRPKSSRSFPSSSRRPGFRGWMACEIGAFPDNFGGDIVCQPIWFMSR